MQIIVSSDGWLHRGCYDGDSDILEIPEIIDGITVIGIAPEAFMWRQNLKEIHIPSTVKEIGNYAFRMCTALRELNFPEGLEKLHDFIADGCDSLNSVRLPASLAFMEFHAFSNKELTFYCPCGSYAEERIRELKDMYDFMFDKWRLIIE